MELVFATHNLNKVREIQAVLPPHITLRTLEDIGCREEIPETADTLEGNALLKATHVLKHYGMPCFADDTGLEVDALGGSPGVFSARYAGLPKNDSKNVEKLLKDLQGQPNRKARFTTVIALCTHEESRLFMGEVEGVITEFPRGNKGFGYDPVFQPEGYGETFAELSLPEKNRISHRARAFAKLLLHLKRHFPQSEDFRNK
ncbi:XTP/dITP diphosphohydrolase [Muriicola jejuensis]|uniref:dITP/XTP pyrophosphatase n=1 Tax=Muriicola jejuensis TaxID=504488 RepID=A0A6P0UL79_9FLAO|nr:non-canonical purine NTP diphosphatase [Muriicola jejuensis]NER10996.1 non-canonical purine NTP diphosphatase [Muriicola jejuensis]SMP14990.1 XTP/dITP diphosphohydrolase [Muriicola jejuensis]